MQLHRNQYLPWLICKPNASFLHVLLSLLFLLSFISHGNHKRSENGWFFFLILSIMFGLETAAAVATIIGIVASPFFQTMFESLKKHLKRSSSRSPIQLPINASSSSIPPLNDPQPPLPITPTELLALEEAMGNIPLLLRLSQSIETNVGGISKFLIQLREAAYAADDLVDELDYEDLQLNILDAAKALAQEEEASTSQAEADSIHAAIDEVGGMAAGAASPGAAAVQPSPGAASSSPSSHTSQVGCFAQLKMFFFECFRYCRITETASAPAPLQLPPQPPSEPTTPLPPEPLHLPSSQPPLPAPAVPYQQSRQDKVTNERIRSLVEDLNRIASRLKEACTLVMASSRSGKVEGISGGPRVSTSTVNSTKVYGRDEDKQKIMDILMTEQTHGKDPQLSIIAIVGVGGVGKTTLAQYVFNDADLNQCFDFKLWIYVSDEFRRERIIKEIIMDTASSKEKTSNELQSITSMDTLERMLKDNVKNKRLLLVLDDVWSNQWTEILMPLQNSIKLCKIIVTTREKKNVKLPVIVSHCESEIMELEGLDDAVYQRLFDEHAFGTQSPAGHPKGAMLQQISRQIAKKMKGSPLAAKTVGAVLRERPDIEHWRQVQKSDLWSVGTQDAGDIMPALMLSYLHLPTCLQRCFSYCAIFPKDHDFEKEGLVNMWIAQSYVSCSRQDERPEDVGSQYFDDLVSRSFFTQSTKNCYRLHDLLHDLALFVSLKECCVYHSGNWHGDPETCHHLSIRTRAGQLPESLKLQLKNARSLMTIGERSTIDSFDGASEILKSLKRVRVLVLTRISSMSLANQMILQDIGHLIHLRYLDLSRIAISKVPESLCRLYHLQTLLFYPYEEISFPERMCNLVNLRHLVAEKTSIASIPYIGNLSRLQELASFRIRKDRQYNIAQLMEMNELGGELHIMNMDSVESTDDAVNARLEKKQRLKVLQLDWGYATDGATAVEHHDAVLECVRPNEQLEELQIRGHPGCNPPSWIAPSSLTYIQRIYLLGCSHWRKLPGIAKLPHLEYLRMEGMSLVLELCDDDVFPSLVELDLRQVSLSFRKGEEAVAANGVMFPQLQKMELFLCQKLEGLTMPSSLKALSINKCDVELPAFLKGLSSLTTLEIRYQDRFTSFDKEVTDSLLSLKQLTIWSCNNFQSLPDGGFPGSLEKLEVVQCSRELHAKLEDLKSPEWAMVQHIPNRNISR